MSSNPNKGYKSVGSYPTTTCVDINECTESGADCDNNGVCNNHDGGYSCACDAGYETDGVTCNSIDECTAGGIIEADCGPGSCVELDGSFESTCDLGYVTTINYPSTICANINQCDPSAGVTVVAGCS